MRAGCRGLESSRDYRGCSRDLRTSDIRVWGESGLQESGTYASQILDGAAKVFLLLYLIRALVAISIH
jgi:hypothetical protein